MASHKLEPGAIDPISHCPFPCRSIALQTERQSTTSAAQQTESISVISAGLQTDSVLVAPHDESLMCTGLTPGISLVPHTFVTDHAWVHVVTA